MWKRTMWLHFSKATHERQRTWLIALIILKRRSNYLRTVNRIILKSYLQWVLEWRLIQLESKFVISPIRIMMIYLELCALDCESIISRMEFLLCLVSNGLSANYFHWINNKKRIPKRSECFRIIDYASCLCLGQCRHSLRTRWVHMCCVISQGNSILRSQLMMSNKVIMPRCTIFWLKKRASMELHSKINSSIWKMCMYYAEKSLVGQKL